MAGMRNVASSIGARRKSIAHAAAMGKNRPNGMPRGSWEGLHSSPKAYVTPRNSGYYNPIHWKAKALHASKRQAFSKAIDNAGVSGSLGFGAIRPGMVDNRVGVQSGSAKRLSKMMQLDTIR